MDAKLLETIAHDQTEFVGGLRIIQDWDVPRNEAYAVPSLGGATWFVHPFDYLIQLGKGRLPYETRYCVGMRELERDRRRR